MKTIKGYKFIQKNMASKNGDCRWKLKEWKKFDGELKMCSQGFHASLTPLDSLKYIYGDMWFVAEARGKILKDDDKFAASEMRLAEEIPVKKVLCWFAIACARRSLKYWDKKYPNDKRPLKSIEAAEIYLKNPNTGNLNELKNAESAARSAWSAARSAWSAESAAWSAEIKWQNEILLKLIKNNLRK